MTSATLKKKLKVGGEQFSDAHRTRLHRAISWLKAAESYTEDPDVQFITLWISFNACYAADGGQEQESGERSRFNEFLSHLIRHDGEKRFFKILWEKFSGPVQLLIRNEFLFGPFWEFQRGSIKEWKNAHERSVHSANIFLAEQEVGKLLSVVMDRLYILRNQLVHGGATYKSKINRSQIRDAINLLKLLLPLVIDIMMDNPDDNWGKIYYPVVT